MPNDWRLYRELIRFGLSFCDDLDGFDRLTAEQQETMAVCWREAPEVAREIWRMANAKRDRLSDVPPSRFRGH